MKAVTSALVLLLAVGLPAASSAQKAASIALLQRAANPNPALKSYTATVQLSATVHAVIPVHKTLNGTVYYLKPQRKIEFQNVPGPLSRFKDMAASTPTYDQVASKYTVTPLTDDGTTSKYMLVPKDSGSRVKSLTLFVNDQTALVNQAQWSYTNGGSLNFQTTYTTTGGFILPTTSSIAARFPGYSVNGTLTFSAYQLNASVSPSIFSASS